MSAKYQKLPARMTYGAVALLLFLMVTSACALVASTTWSVRRPDPH